MDDSEKKNCGPQRTFQVNGKSITICHMRIISLNLHGLRRKEMAVALGVETSTISSHFNRLYRNLATELKLDASSDSKKKELRANTALLKWAIKHSFEEGGYFNGEFLFDGVDNHPFDKPEVTEGEDLS